LELSDQFRPTKSAPEDADRSEGATGNRSSVPTTFTVLSALRVKLPSAASVNSPPRLTVPPEASMMAELVHVPPRENVVPVGIWTVWSRT